MSGFNVSSKYIDPAHEGDLVDFIANPVAMHLLSKVNKDLLEISKGISTPEARYLVDFYYSIQRFRIRSNNAAKAMEKLNEANDFMFFIRGQMEIIEANLKKALDYYTDSLTVGSWARTIKGIGPVITAGMLSRFDITKAPTVGHFYTYCGHNPKIVWGKGQKLPWNAPLKRILYLLGESFVKCSNYEDGFYGHLYKFYKERENLRNDNMRFAEQAKASLTKNNYGKDTKARACYEQGKLPPARIHLRATRRAVDVFLSHLHTVWWWDNYNAQPPRPYIFKAGEHKDFMLPLNLTGKYEELENILHKMYPEAITIEQFVDKHTGELNKGIF